MVGQAQILKDEVYVRVWFERVGNYDRFQKVKNLFLAHFPTARWDPIGKTWLLSVTYSAQVEQFCRKVFGRDRVFIENSTTEAKPRQLRLL